MLELESIDLAYGGVQVLWDVSLRVGEGEIVAVMGPNGSGKSTVLKAAMGLAKPARGRITLGGEDLTRAPATVRPAKGMSIVLERRRLFGSMTVRENLLLGAYTRSRGEAAEGLDEALAIFPELREFLDARAGRLSGGQQQMVAIARGLMARPRILLMDEPFLGLSPAMTLRVRETMRAINDRGVAILFNEQNARLSFAMSHRAYVLESGRVALSGSGEEMLAHPEVRRVYLGIKEEAA